MAERNYTPITEKDYLNFLRPPQSVAPPQYTDRLSQLNQILQSGRDVQATPTQILNSPFNGALVPSAPGQGGYLPYANIAPYLRGQEKDKQPKPPGVTEMVANEVKNKAINRGIEELGSAAATKLGLSGASSAPPIPEIYSGQWAGGAEQLATDAPFFDSGGALQSTLGSTGAGALGAAGLITGGKGMYDAYKSRDPVGGAISGAAAGAGGLALAGSLGLATGGLALPVIAGAAALGGGAGLFGEKPSGRDVMQERIGKLGEKGVYVPDAQQRLDDYGLTREELVAREQAKIDAGGYGNTAFAASRNEADLGAEDTWGGLMWFEQFGNDYLDSTAENQRRAMNERALEEGIIEEKRGQLYFTDKARAREIYQDVLANVPPEGVAPEELPGPVSTGGGGQSSRGPRRDREPRSEFLGFQQQAPAPVLPPPGPPTPPEPTIKSSTDYANAYLDMYASYSQQFTPFNRSL